MNGAESDFHGRDWAPETVGNVKKYELTDQTIQHCGRTLYRIRALVEIKSESVSVGDYGGYVETENNLSMGGSAWVAGDAEIFGQARLGDAVKVSGKTRMSGDGLEGGLEER